MWIKQRNTAIEYLYEKYTEPLSTITWVLDKYHQFNYPVEYIRNGIKWLLKNHPHDSICGCSIDQVHDEMKTRFDWAEQIGNEVFKNSFIYLNDLIKFKIENKDQIELIIYNPLPWKREDIVKFDIVALGELGTRIYPSNLKILENSGKEVEYQYFSLKGIPNFTREQDTHYQLTFLAKVPACGYKVYYIISQENSKIYKSESENFKLIENSIENEFYLITISGNGKIDVYNKLTRINYENICQFEDVGDWGDEYDYSGPNENQIELKFLTKDAKITEISHFLNGPTHKTIKINMNLKLPVSLSKNRNRREDVQVDNDVVIYISLYKGIERIDFKVELTNKSKDHRIRVLFPSNIKSNKVYADGHFYIVPRNVELPNSEGWMQKALPTNHQKDFVSVSDEKACFAVLNKGLPEYEAIRENNGTITLAITLLRCVEWLSRMKFATRRSIAGPDIKTPDAQCLGKHEFEFSLIIKEKELSLLNSEIHVKGKEFNNPLRPIFLSIIKQTPLRFSDIFILNAEVLRYFQRPYVKTVESYLPTELSFLEIDNKNIQLSALKKSEIGKSLIVRCYNLASTTEKTILKFYEGIMIKNATLVNLLEEKPINEIKANLDLLDENNIELSLKPHVIATIKIEFELR
jgi:mannosylglycerate hydrolase